MQSRSELTQAQQDTLMAIHKFRSEKGYMPTYRDLAKERSICVSYATQLVDRLIAKGYLNAPNNRPRSFEFSKRSSIEANLSQY